MHGSRAGAVQIVGNLFLGSLKSRDDDPGHGHAEFGLRQLDSHDRTEASRTQTLQLPIDIFVEGFRRHRWDVLETARKEADTAGVADRCVFTLDTDEQADVIMSIDGFEHYADPAHVLRTMRRLVRPDGRLFITFGPPWFHPLGGHLFSVFPWAHLVFTEKALIRWRSDFKSDGATRFCEVGGGLNQMTVRRFRRLVDRSDFAIERFESVPIRRLRSLSNALTREFLTAMVRCELRPRPTPAEHSL